MYKESATIEATKKPETQENHEVPQSVESPEDLRQQIMSESEKETDHFKSECADDIAQTEVRAEKDELTIDGEDKKALRELVVEADEAKVELAAEFNEGIRNSESQVEKANIIKVEKDNNFKGSIIIKTQDAEGRTIGFALRKNSRGEMEGNKIGYMNDGSIGATYQLHESDFAKLKQQGILESYENSLLQEDKIEFARKEIDENVELEYFEKKAGNFLEASGQNASVEMAEMYENEYAIPAYNQAKKLKNLIEANNSERYCEPEKEKPFNAISSIIKDKNALCIHFLTGFSNANNKTGSSGIESTSGDTFSKRSKEALKQLSTLAGLGPSVSTSMFADTHNFEETWYRNVGQPIGVILRDGECNEIASGDAASRSASPKHRSGGGEIITADGLNKILSPENNSFSKSSYNEFVVAEPKIGALFLTTNNPIEKECLKKLLQENDQFGYPLLFENKGKFYQIPLEDLEGLLKEGAGSAIDVNKCLTESREVSREAIRNSISTMEGIELESKEKQRFDQYIENYELKPHFEWAGELESVIKTKNAYSLDKEIKKNESRENALTTELETEGKITDRLTEYFNEHSQLGKHWEENKEETIVYDAAGNVFEGFPPPDGFTMKTKRSKTEFWEYEEVILDQPATKDIIGIGEASNFQTETKHFLRVIKFPSGKITKQSFERISVLMKTTDRDGNEKMKTVHSRNVREEMRLDNNEKERVGTDNQIDDGSSFLRPLSNSIDYKEHGIIIKPEDLEAELSVATYMNDERRKNIAAHAFTMAEICFENGEKLESEKWKNLAEKNSGNLERYSFIKSKLNTDGTLKLNNEDVLKL